LRTLLTRYLYALTRHIAQAGACHHLHSMEARCARWLLMLQDGVGRETFVLTQQFLSDILGVRLATVNLVLRHFKRVGLLASVRGKAPQYRRNRACEDIAVMLNGHKWPIR